MNGIVETVELVCNNAANDRGLAGDVIFVSLEDWDQIWRRNQFICSTLARRFPHRRILFVGTPWNLTYHLRRGSVRQLFRRLTRTLEELPNITVTNAPKLLPESFALGRKFNEWVARWHVGCIARRLGIRDPILWLNPQSAVHMADRMGEQCVIYDITDDWTLAPSFSEAERKLVVADDRALCKRADLVIVCSESLAKGRRDIAKNLLLLRNGVDVSHYSQHSTKGEGIVWHRPVFGYTGTLHRDRTDVDLIIHLARSFPDGTVVLVGPNHLEDEDIERLNGQPNIRLEGPVSYTRIPSIMAQFDVCVVPHVETPFTNSLNPIKLWEYLAFGKPIVSTNVAGFRDYPDLCRIASGNDEFVAACRLALEERDNLRPERIAEARKHTWDARVDALLAAMKEMMGERRVGALA